jgi:hypothetical protein
MDQQTRDAQEEIGEGTRSNWVSELKFAQIAGGALAAVIAAIAGSALGVHGTVIGAGIASVVVTVGTTLASSSLQRGGQMIRPGLRRVRVIPDQPRLSPKQWRTIGVSTAATMLVALAALTTFEMITGTPVSGLTGGDTGGARTSIGALAGGSDSDPGRPATTADSTSEQENDDEQSSTTVPDEGTPAGDPSELTKPVETTEPTSDPTESTAPTPEPSATPTPTPAPTSAAPAEQP